MVSKAQGKSEAAASMPAADLGLLGFHLDGVSWDKLEAEHPALAGALQEVVRNGYRPQEIRQYTMQRGLPVEWARWLEQAARFLLALDARAADKAGGQ